MKKTMRGAAAVAAGAVLLTGCGSSPKSLDDVSKSLVDGGACTNPISTGASSPVPVGTPQFATVKKSFKCDTPDGYVNGSSFSSTSDRDAAVKLVHGPLYFVGTGDNKWVLYAHTTKDADKVAQTLGDQATRLS